MLVIGTGDTLQGVAGTATAVTITVTGVSVNNSTGAETFGKLFQGQLPISAGILFTVPASVSWIIKTLVLSNSTGGSVSGVQLFISGVAGTNSIVGPFAFGAGFTATFSENGWSVIDASGNIQTSGGGGGGGITQLTSDVTAGPGSGSQVATISAHAVTYAKMQTVSANSKLLGSGATGGGSSPAEITLGTGLTMTGTTLSSSATATGQLLNIQTILATGAGSYTPTTGTNSIIIELVGGGGGGGGTAANPGSSQSSFADGGQGGGWLRKRLTTGFSSATYVVGTAGAGGAAGANNGVAGADTTFTVTGPTTYTAKGGALGTHLGPFAVGWFTGLPTPNLTTGGDAIRSGGVGPVGFSFNAFSGSGCAGGSSMYSPGAPAAQQSGASNSSVAGASADGFGGGGGGAIAEGTAVAQAGGSGSQGVIIIWEYS